MTTERFVTRPYQIRNCIYYRHTRPFYSFSWVEDSGFPNSTVQSILQPNFQKMTFTPRKYRFHIAFSLKVMFPQILLLQKVITFFFLQYQRENTFVYHCFSFKISHNFCLEAANFECKKTTSTIIVICFYMRNFCTARLISKYALFVLSNPYNFEFFFDDRILKF